MIRSRAHRRLAYTFCVGAVVVMASDVIMRGSRAGLAFEPREQTPYVLPWTEGDSHRCTQGTQSLATHRGRFSTSWDFMMWPGTLVRAARAGIVAEVERHHSDYPGRHRANFVRVRHRDGTSALYAHLRSDGIGVNVGDVVAQRDVLAEAGMSGGTIYPHLHFQLRDAHDRPLPSSFRDVDEPDGVPRVWSAYRASSF